MGTIISGFTNGVAGLTPADWKIADECRVVKQVLTECRRQSGTEFDLSGKRYAVVKLLLCENKLNGQSQDPYPIMLDANPRKLEEKIHAFVKEKWALFCPRLTPEKMQNLKMQGVSDEHLSRDGKVSEQDLEMDVDLLKLMVNEPIEIINDILQRWVAEPCEGEERKAAAANILRFVKRPGYGLDFSCLGLTSLPDIFHLPIYRYVSASIDLSGNPLKALPRAVFFLPDDFVTGVKIGDLVLNGSDVLILRCYYQYLADEKDLFPIVEVRNILKEYRFPIDFKDIEGEHRLSSKAWKCIGEINPENPAEHYFIFRMRPEYCKWEDHEKLQDQLFPAIEPHFLDLWGLFSNGKNFSTLIKFLGIRYDEKKQLIMCPGIECLRARWKKLREEIKGIKLPDLKFFSSEGIAPHEEFIEKFLDGYAIISNGPEFIHDMFAHILPLCTGIFMRADREKEVYPEERKAVVDEFGKIYGVILSAVECAKDPHRANSVQDKARIIKYQKLVVAYLGAVVDTVTSTDDVVTAKEVSDVFWNAKLIEDPYWRSYFEREFIGVWDEDDFRDALFNILNIGSLQTSTQQAL